MSILKAPSNDEMVTLIGKDLFDVWTKLCALIETNYDMERLWNSGGKAWKYEYKYRRGGKTLCALHAKENCCGLMIIFGKTNAQNLKLTASPILLKYKIYADATTYHDGKWVMFELNDTSLFPNLEKLLLIKRRPNRRTNVTNK